MYGDGRGCRRARAPHLPLATPLGGKSCSAFHTQRSGKLHLYSVNFNTDAPRTLPVPIPTPPRSKSGSHFYTIKFWKCLLCVSVWHGMTWHDMLEANVTEACHSHCLRVMLEANVKEARPQFDSYGWKINIRSFKMTKSLCTLKSTSPDRPSASPQTRLRITRYTYLFLYIYIYVYIYLHIFTYIYTSIYMYTYV